MGQNNSTGLPGPLRTISTSHSQPQQELDSFHEERSDSPQTSASSATESTIPNSPPQKRRCMAKGESSQSPEEASKYLSGDNGIRFHIHPRDEIKICDCFLLGGCTQGDSCPLHHTRYPYHWQIRWRDSKAWQSVSESAQRHLEKLYCDTGKEQIKFVDKGGAVGSIFLHSMKLVCFAGPYDKVRRLSNTSDPKENPRFPTEWAAYWKSNGNWMKYEEPISQGLLAACEQDKDSYTFERQGHFFIVDLKRRVQRNRDKGYVRLVQRRPSYRPLLSMVPYLMTLPRRPQGTVPSTSDVLGENPKDGYCGSYPAAWVPKPPDGQAFLKMEVLPTEVAYHRVCALFHQSLSEEKTLVLGIYRIRNDDLWEKYTRRNSSWRSTSSMGALLTSWSPSARRTLTPASQGCTPPSTAGAAISPRAPSIHTATARQARPGYATCSWPRCWWARLLLGINFSDTPCPWCPVGSSTTPGSTAKAIPKCM
ncbi:protein mono-ADP-ribosyltransferase TIPARP-like isoform X2 [Mauremys mutica]|uniref:protein mono-ADP-ribosyltransferase TIPARP-like isoform X2 n=1 Tax=Mauremys mutica TaxID=74926 RepID=UPI001D13DE59|nr:protein mono-ADP-ribosyltransferase TIPARP-like isoform X2 [Mauremys mutica]